MAKILNTEGFDLAKERFVLIGVLGQTYSGQSTFFDTVLSKTHYGVQDFRGVFEDIVLDYLEGDSTCVQWYEDHGIQTPYYDSDNIIYDEPGTTDVIFSEEYLRDKEKMHLIRRHSFNKKMMRISESLEEMAADIMTGTFTREMQIPLFVDLPMCGGIDYYEYVDLVILIKRPTEPDPHSWYVQYMCADHAENIDNFIDLCVPSNKEELLLASDDEAFSEIVIDESKTIVIENYGTIDEYYNKIEEVLDRYRDKSRSAIHKSINNISEELFNG